MSRRTLAALALLGAACSLYAPGASAYVPTGAKWSQLPVAYKVNQATIPQSIASFAVSAVDAGFATWSSPTCTSWKAVNMGNTTAQATAQDQQNTVLWRSDSWPSNLGDVNSTIGITLTSYSGSESFDSDIVFNNVGFTWDNGGVNGNVDAQSIATHEEGHFLGLDHTPSQSAIMYAAYSGGKKRVLTGDDTSGVCALYPCSTGDCGSGGTGGSSGTGGTGGTGAGGAGQSCSECQGTATQPGGACASAASDCGSSPDCQAFLDCLQPCQTQQCVNQCAQQHPQGVQAYQAAVTCICNTGCPTECASDCGNGGSGGSSTGQGSCCDTHMGTPGCGDASVQACVCGQDNYCCNQEWDAQCVSEVEKFGCGSCSGGTGGSSGTGGTSGTGGSSGGSCGLSTANPTCNTCIDGMCCAQSQACTGNAECVAILNCLSQMQCQDNTCANQCAQQHPQGVQAASAFLSCFNGSCGSACTGGGTGGTGGGTGGTGGTSSGTGGTSSGTGGTSSAGGNNAGGGVFGPGGSGGSSSTGQGGTGSPAPTGQGGTTSTGQGGTTGTGQGAGGSTGGSKAGSAAGSGGTSTGAGAGTQTEGLPATSGNASNSSGGCGCRTAGSEAPSSAWGGLAGLALALGAARRKKRA